MNARTKIIIIFFISFTIFLITSPGNTPYNYFTRLADAFLHGKYYITDHPSWLSELIPIGINKFAVVYPPAPAILLIPFVALFGPNFPQNVFANLIGASIVTCSTILCYEVTKSRIKTLWLTLLVAFGNILWFMNSVGSVWLLGQTTSVLFILLAILVIIKNKTSALVGFFLGIAILSRVELIVCLPFFFLLTAKNNRLKFLISLAPFLFFFGIYNFLRFGNFLESGYALIPGVLQEPWYSNGIIHPSYILNNLKIMFTSLPIFKPTFPFAIPSWGGLAIWITSPVFIYAFKNNLKEKIVWLSWISIFLILLIILMHGETGYAQFGFRFAVDFYPFIFLLIIKSLKNSKLAWLHWFLLSLSIFVNAWGVILVNKLNIVAP